MNRTEFIYDGWNLISERKYKTNNLSTLGDQQPTTSHYFWGLDVSGSLGGAGGVGGLLQLAVGSNSPYITNLSAEALAKERQKTDIFGPSSQKSEINNLKLYFPHYDHIGNIIAYTNESEEIAAVYDYSGFGELIRSDGPMKEDFSLQFSTKYIDKETNLYYYGYRFYNPQMGSWISRELLGEEESLNLYEFVRNEPTNAFDYLGLAYMQIRPLDMGWLLNKTTAGPLHHASFKLDKPIYKYGKEFYDNFGYYNSKIGGEVRPDFAKDSLIKMYKNVGEHLDDKTLLEAKKLVDPNYDRMNYPNAPEYHLLTMPMPQSPYVYNPNQPLYLWEKHNCQTYAKDVMEKYNELMAQKEKAALEELIKLLDSLPFGKIKCPGI